MNKFGKAITIIVLLLAAVMIMTMGACADSKSPEPQELTPSPTESAPGTTDVSPTPHPAPDGKAGWLEIVYFHRANRCRSCIYAEEGTRYTIQTYFGDELARGKLVFKVLDLQEEANAAYVRKYEAHTSSLFINEVKDGTDHIEEVADIWTKLGRDEAFIEVVKSAIEEHLGDI